MAIIRITERPELMKELDEFLDTRGLKTNGFGSIEIHDDGSQVLHLTLDKEHIINYSSTLGRRIRNFVEKKFNIDRVVLDGIVYR